MTPAIVNTTELTLQRTIDASPAEVFDVWINPKEPGSPWYGVAKAIVQPVVDGLFYHLVQFGGQDWAHYGRFTILDRPRRIEHTWVSRATQGLESIVSLTLKPAGNGTTVELRHRNVPDDEVGRQHQYGWGFVLGAIADKFAQRKEAGSKVVLERTYHARVEELWDLWTSKKGFESWWGPEGFHVEVRTLEGRVGGALHYEMIADAPEQIAAMKRMGRPTSHEAHARFTEMRPRERLAITSLIDFLPGVKSYETTITVEFFPSGESVRMVVTLDPMHDEGFTKMSTLGFTSQLTKLDKRFGGSGNTRHATSE